MIKGNSDRFTIFTFFFKLIRLTDIKMRNTPVDSDIIRRKVAESGLTNLGTATIREILKLVGQIEKESGVKYVRMEMGVPGLPSPQIAIDAEIEALRKRCLS